MDLWKTLLVVFAALVVPLMLTGCADPEDKPYEGEVKTAPDPNRTQGTRQSR